jgi:hypothetical protein
MNMNEELKENYKRDYLSEKIIIEFEKKEELNNLFLESLDRKSAKIELEIPKKVYESQFQNDILPF